MEFEMNGSGWSLDIINYMEININKYNPLRTSSCIPLCKSISNKKAVIKVQNNDQCCFAWSLVSILYPTNSQSDRINLYPHFSTVFDFTNNDFFVKLKDIKKF